MKWWKRAKHPQEVLFQQHYERYKAMVKSREEFIRLAEVSFDNKRYDREDATNLVDFLALIGLLKFEPETDKSYCIKPDVNTRSMELNKDCWFGNVGIIRLERQPEGLVVWVGGEIRYKSWQNKPSHSVEAAIRYARSSSNSAEGFIKDLDSFGYKIVPK